METTLLGFLPVNHGLVNRAAAAARVKTTVCANETRETGRGIKSLLVLLYFVRLVYSFFLSFFLLFSFFQIPFFSSFSSLFAPSHHPPPPPHVHVCVLGVCWVWVGACVRACVCVCV